MTGDIRAQRTPVREGRHLNPFEVFLWFFMRISGAILMVIAVFHLIYMQFIIPGGVAAIDFSVVIARWSDPSWGFFWRTFDLLLLVFSLAHGSNGIRNIIEDYIRHKSWRIISKTALYLLCAVLVVMGTIVIFGFEA